jgi:hypothetical protein
MHFIFLLQRKKEKLKGRDHLGDPDVDGRIII